MIQTGWKPHLTSFALKKQTEQIMQLRQIILFVERLGLRTHHAWKPKCNAKGQEKSATLK